MLRPVVLAVVALRASSQMDFGDCDEEYECEYRAPNGMFYNLYGLCENGTHTWTDPVGNWTYYWLPCGVVPKDCYPTYHTLYPKGAAMMFDVNPPTGSDCTDVHGNPQTCTSNCEVLGAGPPIITLAYPGGFDAGGVNISHYGVPSLPDDAFPCGDDANGNPISRSVTIQILCDPQEKGARFAFVQETSLCQYLIRMYSQYGCGCAPTCAWVNSNDGTFHGSNCGRDSCPGTGMCGPAAHKGQCPPGQVCATLAQAEQVCCTPDCNNRQCGSNGCGGFCGNTATGLCPAGLTCTQYQQCVGTQPSQAPIVRTVTRYTTVPGDYAASFIGGVFTVGALAGIVMFARRLKTAL